MEELKEKRKKGILRKTWERCKSFGHIQNTQRVPISPTTPTSPTSFSNNGATMVKSKSWSTPLTSTSLPSSPNRSSIGYYKRFCGSCSIPHGCFSVYVGPQKQRFVVKVKCTSHPLFRKLLEEAELEYGFNSDGPLVLPCQVDVFIRVMLEIKDDHNQDDISLSRCSFSKNPNSYHQLSSPRLVSLNEFS